MLRERSVTQGVKVKVKESLLRRIEEKGLKGTGFRKTQEGDLRCI